MPYAHRKKKIPETLDRRRKLTDSQKEEIKKLHNEGIATREIARRYPHVSRRLIQFIIDPEKAEKARQRLKEWQESHGNYRQRVGNKKWAEVIKEHRHYKQSIKDKLK